MKNLGVLVVDMQEKFPMARGDYLLIKKQKQLLKYAKEKEIPVFVLEFIKNGKTISELQPFLTNLNIHLIPKYNNNGFIIVKNPGPLKIPAECYHDGRYDWDQKFVDNHSKKNIFESELSEKLNQNQIKKIIVTGINKTYCFYDTIRGALKRGYEVHTSLELTNEKFIPWPDLDKLNVFWYARLEDVLDGVRK